MAEPVQGISTRLANMNPFSSNTSRRRTDEEDVGAKVDNTSIAGGGHGYRASDITQNRLRVSHALKSFIVHHEILAASDVGADDEQQTPALHALVEKPHVDVPAALTDRSHPLPEYFVSSSHNTYLLAHQLYGSSCATAYETALGAGARCVEIDAWDGDDRDEPKVTHGYTLVSNIPFRDVCTAIRDVVDREARMQIGEQGYRSAPIFLSLENHCAEYGQQRLVDIMKEIFEDRLLSQSVRRKGREEQAGVGDMVTLEELGSRICVIVEHYLPTPVVESDDEDDDSESDTEEQKDARKEYRRKKATAPSTTIIPSLADVGVYAQSIKPSDNSWFDQATTSSSQSVLSFPPHHLVNVSESALSTHLPAHTADIAKHNGQALMRVYPKGTRISSANLNPVPFWGLGAQIAALNWQTFGAALQLNEALFAGTDGYVLKPAALRAGGSGILNTGRRLRLRLHIAGATDVPIQSGRDAEDLKPYISATLVHPDDVANEPPKRKTKSYKQYKLGFLHRGENPSPTEPVWDEILEWEYLENELVFVRVLLKDDVRFAGNPILGATAVRLSYVPNKEWRFVRLFDVAGHETQCSVLLKFEVEEA